MRTKRMNERASIQTVWLKHCWKVPFRLFFCHVQVSFSITHNLFWFVSETQQQRLQCRGDIIVEWHSKFHSIYSLEVRYFRRYEAHCRSQSSSAKPIIVGTIFPFVVGLPLWPRSRRLPGISVGWGQFFFLRGECGKFSLLSPLLQLAISFYVWILSNVHTMGTKSLSAFVAAFVMQIATSWLLFIMARNPNMRYLVLVSIDEQIEFSLSLSSQSWFGCSRFYGSFICAENLFCVCLCFYVVV